MTSTNLPFHKISIYCRLFHNNFWVGLESGVVSTSSSTLVAQFYYCIVYARFSKQRKEGRFDDNLQFLNMYKLNIEQILFSFRKR